jgi:hypothetical protein
MRVRKSTVATKRRVLPAIFLAKNKPSPFHDEPKRPSLQKNRSNPAIIEQGLFNTIFRFFQLLPLVEEDVPPSYGIRTLQDPDENPLDADKETHLRGHRVDTPGKSVTIGRRLI